MARDLGKAWVKGFDAAFVIRANSRGLAVEKAASDEVDGDHQPRIPGGYDQVVAFLAKECRAAKILFNARVGRVTWRADGVELHAASRVIHARKALVTVSAGVLKNGDVKFVPPLVKKAKALASIEMGQAVQVIMQSSEPFWENRKFHRECLANRAFILAREASFPTYRVE
jgi:monoamine oxidase